MLLNALSNSSAFGGFVNKETIGTTINGAIIPILDAIGDLLSPNMKKSDIETTHPVIIPAKAPCLVVLFQYKPKRYGAIRDPATTPHDNDIRVTITVNLYLAIK